MSLEDLYVFFILLSAIASLLIFFQKNKNPRFWYFFPLLLFAAFFVEWVATIMADRGENNTTIYNVFIVFEFVFYFWMFAYFVRSIAIKRIIWHLLWIFPMLALINKCYIQTGAQLHTLTIGVGGMLIVLCATCYFYELFRAKKTIDLVKEPAFWITSGLLFFYGCTLPLFVFIFSAKRPSYVLVHYTFILVSVSNVLLYSSFTIGFLCKFRMRKFAYSLQQENIA